MSPLPQPYTAPGRLGDPSMTLGTDPRALPELIKAAKLMGVDGYNYAPPPDLNDMSALEKIMAESSQAFGGLYESMPNDLPGDENESEVEQTKIEFDGVDGNKLKLFVFRKKDMADLKLPAVVYIHGGGMTILETTAKPHFRWCKSLALMGSVAIAVDFRNAWQPGGEQVPFPAGLNDCASAIQHIHANRSKLGISKIVLQGESGGANLCLATALKANREGWVSAIDGVYGGVPLISGGYDWPQEKKLRELPSIVENEGYFLSLSGMTAMAKWYSPEVVQMTNPLAWPYHATKEDMKGLPPHVLSMDELDPLRDEGIKYFRKLVTAGVRATADVNLGIPHAASLIFRQTLPDVHNKALRQVVAFAQSL